MLALGGCRPPGEVWAGPGSEHAAMRGLCRPLEGSGRQEGSVPALGECRPSGGVCAGPWRVQAARRGVCRPWVGACPGRGLCWPWEGTDRQEGSVLALGVNVLPGEVCAGPGSEHAARRGLCWPWEAARRDLCRPWEGAGRQEGSVPAFQTKGDAYTCIVNYFFLPLLNFHYLYIVIKCEV